MPGPTKPNAFVPTLTITALDAFGNTATSFAGQVAFSTTDALANLPSDYTFTSSDQGTHNFTATFGQADGPYQPRKISPSGMMTSVVAICCS